MYLPKYAESCLRTTKKFTGSNNLLIFTGYNEFFNNKIRNFSLHLFIKDTLLFPYLFKPSISCVHLKKFMLSLGNPIPCPAAMYHKSAIGKFSFSSDFKCNMDWDAWLRLSAIKGSFIYVKDKLMLHRLDINSQTSLQIKKNIRLREDNLILERLWPRPMASFLGRAYSLAIRFNKYERITRHP